MLPVIMVNRSQNVDSMSVSDKKQPGPKFWMAAIALSIVIY